MRASAAATPQDTIALTLVSTSAILDFLALLGEPTASLLDMLVMLVIQSTAAVRLCGVRVRRSFLCCRELRNLRMLLRSVGGCLSLRAGWLSGFGCRVCLCLPFGIRREDEVGYRWSPSRRSGCLEIENIHH